MTMNAGYAKSSLILIFIFTATLTAQLISRRYHAFLFWTVILSTSTAGATMPDCMDRTLELGYPMGSTILLTALFCIFALWRHVEGMVSINTITARKAEVFYWAAILISNTLGTAMGDCLADSSGLGFGGGALLIGSLIALTIIAHYFSRISHIFLFWAAFILTRPFGATIGDLMTKSHEKGGFDFGTAGSSAVLAGILLTFIVFAHRAQTRSTGKFSSG